MNVASFGGSQMPIDLKITHAEHRVTVTARGEINAADFDRIFLAQVQEHALSYGKLFDLRGIAVDLSPSDLMAHAGKLAAYATSDEIGALALVVDSLTSVDSSVLAALAAAKRPCRMFQDTSRAVEWLRRVRLNRTVRMAKL